MTAEFVPEKKYLSAATNSLQAVFTTTEDHTYSVGQYVRLHIPAAYGMVLYFVKGKILSLPADDQFETDIDTSQLSAFSIPSEPPAFSPANVCAVSGLWNNVAT